LGKTVYFQEDIARALTATRFSIEAALSTDTSPLSRAYREGALSALISVGFAFGLDPTASQEQAHMTRWRSPPKGAFLDAHTTKDATKRPKGDERG